MAYSSWTGIEGGSNDAGLARFSTIYSRTKALGILAAAVWVFGLIEVGLADLLKLSVLASFAFSALVVVTLSVVAYLYYRAGVSTKSSPGACSASEGQGCSQPGCDSSSGGCFGKIESEIKSRISQMERERLTLLLRRKVGVDIILPLFWIAVGVKLVISGGSSADMGGWALIAGSFGLIAARVYLGVGVFS